MIIVSGGQKGGTGKTMLATMLAVLFKWMGLDVLLVDADPSQGSSSEWANERRAAREAARKMGVETPIPHVPCVTLAGIVYDELRDLERRYDVIVVDCGGAESEEFTSACLAAVAVYTTILPSACDLKTMPKVEKAIKLSRAGGNRELVAKVILNQCSNNRHATDRQRAREKLAQYPALVVSERSIGFRESFMDAYGEWLSVNELAVHGSKEARTKARKAAAEAWAIFEEVCADVEIPVHEVLVVPGVHAVQDVQEVQEVQ
jgi:chromosome partitioning protein